MKLREYVVLIEEDEDGMLVASVPALKGCHTQARDIATLMKRIKEAIRLCLEVETETSEPLKFVGLQEVKISS